MLFAFTVIGIVKALEAFFPILEALGASPNGKIKKLTKASIDDAFWVAMSLFLTALISGGFALMANEVVKYLASK